MSNQGRNIANFPGAGRAAQPSRPFAIQPGQTVAVVCESCGFDLFMPMVMIRKVSALISPTGKDEKINIEVAGCALCGHVNADLLPPGVERAPMPESPPMTESEG